VKTQLLYLDSHDDAASTLEKLRWAQADRVVLVWPSHGRILLRRVELVLLVREAERQAAQLGLLSHDPDVRASARGLGLPVFDDLDAVSRAPWPAKSTKDLDSGVAMERAPLPPRPERNATPTRRRWTDAQRAGWMLVVIAALLLLSIAIGPAAVIEISTVEEEPTLTIPVTFGERGQDPSEGIVLPSHSVEVEVDAELRLPTTGKVQAATRAAEGQAVLTNRTQAEVILPEGTGLRTLGSNPQRFETIERALVPAGIGSELVVPIRASAPGRAGNVPAGSIGAIEGTLGLALTVTNPDPTSGGETEARPGVSQADLREVRSALERQLVQSANARLQEQLAEGEALAPISFTIAEVVASAVHPSLGEPSEVVEGSMTARITATVFDVDRLQQAAVAAMAQAAGSGMTIVPGSVRVDLVPAGSAAAATYQARVQARTRPDFDFGEMARPIAGMTTADAAAFLATAFDLETLPRIRLWPGWWPRLPLLPLRIEAVWGPFES